MPPFDFQGQEDVLFDGAPREEFVFLQHIAEAAAALHAALGRLQKACGEGEERRLSATGGADDRNELALVHAEGQVLCGKKFTVRGVIDIGYVLKLQNVLHRRVLCAEKMRSVQGGVDFPDVGIVREGMKVRRGRSSSPALSMMSCRRSKLSSVIAMSLTQASMLR